MNKANMIGNLTADPELRVTPAGVPVCKFTIAVNRRYKDKNGNAITDFFNVVAWRQLGEICAKYLAKGHKCGVVGELQNHSYEAKDGSKRYKTELVADEVEFLTPKNSAAASGAAAAGFAEQSRSAENNAAPATTSPAAYDSTPGYYSMGFEEIDDDDLPF